jgi:hypothetical protein
MIRRMSAVALGALLVLILARGAAASQTSTSDVPDSCAVLPVGILDVLAMLNDVDQARSYRYLPNITSVSLNEIVPGDPISAGDMEGIDLTTRNLVGCANTLNIMSVLALLTDDFQTRLVVEAMDQPDMSAIVKHLPILATDTTDNAGVQAIPIRSAWYADEDERRILAVLEPAVSEQSSQRSFLVTFVFSIDRWLIDDVRLITNSSS